MCKQFQLKISTPKNVGDEVEKGTISEEVLTPNFVTQFIIRKNLNVFKALKQFNKERLKSGILLNKVYITGTTNTKGKTIDPILLADEKSNNKKIVYFT